MAKDYTQLVNKIIENIGGKENITNCTHCLTRLRIDTKDKGLINLEEIKNLDVIGAQFLGDQLQVIIGKEINEVYDEFCKVAEISKKETINENLDEKKKLSFKDVVNKILDGISGSIIPILPAIVGSGMIKAILMILVQLGALSSESPTYITLSFAADAAFYFLPIYLGAYAAKKFGGTPALGMLIGGILLHPNFINMVNSGDAGSVFGIKITAASYSSTILPTIMSTYVMCKIEAIANKYCPKILRVVVVPIVTLLISIPITLCVLGPIGTILSKYVAMIITVSYNAVGPIAVGLLVALCPFIVVTGTHTGLIPVSLQMMATLGYDPIALPAFVTANFAIGGALLAVAFKTKHKDRKALGLSCAFQAIVPGIAEPGLYGILLKYKTPFIGTTIGGLIAGLFIGFTKAGCYSFMAPNLFALVGFVGEGTNSFTYEVIAVVIAVISAFISTWLLYKDEK